MIHAGTQRGRLFYLCSLVCVPCNKPRLKLEMSTVTEACTGWGWQPLALSTRSWVSPGPPDYPVRYYLTLHYARFLAPIAAGVNFSRVVFKVHFGPNVIYYLARERPFNERGSGRRLWLSTFFKYSRAPVEIVDTGVARTGGAKVKETSQRIEGERERADSGCRRVR